MKFLKYLLLIPFTIMCASKPPLQTVPNVDIKRFMGEWYVIANIPTFLEKGAHNAIEKYELTKEGNISTTFTFKKDSFDGPSKKYNPKGFIVDKVNNSTWDMQFLFPFKSEFLIIYLNDDYTQTIIGRTKRDYVWIMSKTPEIPESDYNKILKFLEKNSYDIKEIKKVPQKWK